MSALTLTLVQTRTHWHDPAANRDHFEGCFAQLPEQGDLVVLPEMFSTGFTMASATQAEPMDGPTPRWLMAMAERYQRVFCGSVVIRTAQGCYNRLLWAAPGQPLAWYDKRHRFRMAGEHEHYAAGDARAIFELRGFRICPLVCYDLRFPVWSRNIGDYDLLLYVANWPAARHSAWQRLLPARAIENLSYVAAVNILGVDGNDVAYAGGSGVWHPDGTALQSLRGQSGCLTATLKAETLARWRANFPAHLDRDAFHLTGDGDTVR